MTWLNYELCNEERDHSVVLEAHMQPFNGAISPALCLKPPLVPLLCEQIGTTLASLQGSGCVNAQACPSLCCSPMH